MRSRSYDTDALVLRYRSLNEADRIITFYTLDMGRITAIAKGIRRPTSKFGGTLEPLNSVRVSIARTSSIDIIQECVVSDAFIHIKEDLTKIAESIYIAELVDAFSEDWEPNKKLYSLLEDTLKVIDNYFFSPLIIRLFEMRLLSYTGFLPEFRECLYCREPLNPGKYLFDIEFGGVACLDCVNNTKNNGILISEDAMKLLRWLQQSADIRKIKSMNLSTETLLEVKFFMNKYLRQLSERRLKSVKFTSQVDLFNP
jgi:DNA repair protein RecO (recombination protein O)